MGVRTRAALAVLAFLLAAAPARAQRDPFVPAPAAPRDAFAHANDLARAGDLPRAMSAYRMLAATGSESAPLYWNWAQAASARGAHGEAIWALLRARELDPSDPAIDRELEQAREAANLDPAELSPEPLQAARRLGRRFHLDWIALAFAAVSVAAHVAARLTRLRRWPATLAWTAGALALLAGALPLAGASARPTAVVVQPGAPLLEAASATADPLGSLREGEVLPILEEAAGYLRVQDSSGARGWAHPGSVRRLDSPPAAD